MLNILKKSQEQSWDFLWSKLFESRIESLVGNHIKDEVNIFFFVEYSIHLRNLKKKIYSIEFLKMKHIKLFENFTGSNDPAKEILNMMMSDPDYTGYRLSLKDGGDVKFIVWENPEENNKWLNSGYGEDYTPGYDVSMPVLAIRPDGNIFKLAPEEKYSYTYSQGGYSGNAYDESGSINYPKVKNELEDSIWRYDG